MHIPFVDLYAQYQNIKNEIDDSIQSVIKDTAFIKGSFVEKFEDEYAKEYGIKHCIGVANGTDAIYIVLKCLGIGSGDEVITVANSWISTSETISQTGAKPVFIDIEADYYTIDPEKIEEKITKNTKAIIPVHLYGQPAQLNSIKKLCEKHNLFLIEDCAQSHFAKYNGNFVGTSGIASTFSFYPGKNLGAYGDAGAIITNDDDLAKKMRMYANHGALKKHHHEIEGINSRLDGLQAAILSTKLKYIHDWNKKRLENGLYYNKLLSGIIEIKTPKIRDNSTHIFHVYSVRVDNRDSIIAHLKKNNIETAIHYPVALPFMNAYKYLNYTPKDFPIAFEYQSKILSLPMYPELSKVQIEYTVNKLKEAVLNS
ncbi:MAG TPA: DegT/DnrJ/EryC1/StrS family aminotransferase [Ignavibacteriaceae bacterium]|nr:DegT/DnrJ/EryC1/StrS family aminotransferase [Ignavibacteriaceae bacterium]